MTMRKVSGTGTKKKAVVGKRRAPAKRKRHRRISGIGGVDLKSVGMDVLALTAGSAAARELNTILVKQFPTLKPAISGAIQIAAGVLIPMFMKGNKFVQFVGYGMIANGGMVELVNLGVISGVKPDRMAYRINGARDLSTISGDGRFHRIAGSRELSPVTSMSGTARKRPVNRMF